MEAHKAWRTDIRNRILRTKSVFIFEAQYTMLNASQAYGIPASYWSSGKTCKIAKLISPVKSLNSAILNWRSQLDEPSDIALSDKELKTIRKESSGREFSWDE